MAKALRLGMRTCACVAALSAVAALGQQIPDAPVPPAISNAKKVFVSNAGADSGLFPHPFSGGRDRGYNQFYAAVKEWGRYETVSEPEQADLVLELQLIGPNGPTNANKQKGASDPLPMFRVTVLDRKTHYVLWALTESIASANLQKTHDHNFDEAVNALLADLKKITGENSTAAR
jgi:hypothetical protein